MILENKGGGWNIADWNQDESRMIVTNYASINEGKAYLLDIVSGKLEESIQLANKFHTVILYFQKTVKEFSLLPMKIQNLGLYDIMI
jgi:hypothetical protein